MPRRKPCAPVRSRRTYPEEFRREAVQMLQDRHSAPSVAKRLGLSSPTIHYAWNKKSLEQAGPAAQTLGRRVRFLEAELRRVERESDIYLSPIQFEALNDALIHRMSLSENSLAPKVYLNQSFRSTNSCPMAFR
ncbi:MAG TPA: transposase [Lacipirellulaceae bacterium]|nr:transposase [Lacipirellulaceae bacterium]HMP05952.1 transposase [Lacipirellulaceae bacterium]